MKVNPLPDLQYLKECFIIDCSVVEGLRWNPNRPPSHFKKFVDYLRWKKLLSNKQAGRLWNNTYYHTQLNKKNYLNHRIVYALYNNTIDFRDKFIDHIDNNKLNNNPTNLRLATTSQNNYNSKKYKNNKSGYKNITIKNGKYVVELRYQRKYFYLGAFEKLEEAIAVRNEKAKELGGDFIRL